MLFGYSCFPILLNMLGYRYPLEIDPQTGTLTLAEGDNYVASQVVSVLSLTRGQRLGARDIGVNLPLFSPTLSTAVDIETQLARYVGVPSQVAVTLADNGNALVDVRYSGQQTTVEIPTL